MTAVPQSGAPLRERVARTEAEAARLAADADRLGAETARAEAETARAEAETARAEAETARAEAERARAREESARRRFAVLSEASRILGSSLDYETTLRNVAGLAVPQLADCCAVDLLEPGGVIRRVAVAD